jgi:hypothetical protein
MPALLALATLGDPTQIGLVLFCVLSTKVAKASTVVTATCRCHQLFYLDFFINFANVNMVIFNSPCEANVNIMAIVA